MDKRIRYSISSIVSAIGFWFFLTLPFESRYFGLVAGVVLIIFCIWFGLGIIFTDDFKNRMMTAILPTLFFVGYGMFMVLLPDYWWLHIIVSLVFGLVMYLIFLVENVFWVAIGYRTVPLYRAAYTVGLIFMLITAFFTYDSLFSYKLNPWINFLIGGVVSLLLFVYHFWAVSIELPDDGKKKGLVAYASIPALLVGEMALILSFWPIGIFKSSVYLVSMVYVVASLIQLDIRERLFRKTWIQFIWISVAIVMSIIFTTSWR